MKTRASSAESFAILMYEMSVSACNPTIGLSVIRENLRFVRAELLSALGAGDGTNDGT